MNSLSTQASLYNVGRGGHVAATPCPVDVDILALGEVLARELGLDAECVRTKIIPLSLQQVGWQVLGAVTIVEAQSSAEGRDRDTPESALADHVPPSALRLLDGVVEELVKEQVLQIGVLAVRPGDVLEEDRADDAAATPHQGNVGLVQLPAVLLGSLRMGLATVGHLEMLRRIRTLRMSMKP